MEWVAEEVLGECESLDDALEYVIEALRMVKESGLEVHHVAGAISADGDEHIERNLAELLRHREVVAGELGSGVLVLTAPLVFTAEIYGRLGIFNLDRDIREKNLQIFWDGVIGSGLIDAVHLTPGYERSPGANAEKKAAIENNVDIFYIREPNLEFE